MPNAQPDFVRKFGSMNGLSLSTIVRDGLILSIGASAILPTSMALNPRIMRSDYPLPIKEKITPLTTAEKRHLSLTGLLFWGFSLGVIFFSTRAASTRNGSEGLFLTAILNTYLIFSIFSLFDLLVLDYLILIVLKPRFLFVPGIEGMAQYNTFGFHFEGFLNGLGIGIVVSLIVAVVTVVVT